MSSTLKWRPVVIDDGNSLPDDLKFMLRKRFSIPCRLDCHDVKYLQGLLDAEVKGAKELIEAIKTHNFVEISESW